MTRDDVVAGFDALLETERAEAFERGRSKGSQDAAQHVQSELAKKKFELIDQGKAQGLNEAQPLIDAAREAGRVQGVEDGRQSAEMTADKVAMRQAYNEGKQAGYQDGFKIGRGEGYRAGWNDAVNSPPSSHKPK